MIGGYNDHQQDIHFSLYLLTIIISIELQLINFQKTFRPQTSFPSNKLSLH